MQESKFAMSQSVMTRCPLSFRLIGLLCLALVWLPSVQAEEEVSYVEYIDMDPPFVANFGGPGPLKYIKAEVSVKVKSRKAEDEVKLHTPQIRHSLVMLLSNQTDESVNNAAGREKLRQQALEVARQILLEENGEEGYDMVADLLFTSFVVQN